MLETKPTKVHELSPQRQALRLPRGVDRAVVAGLLDVNKSKRLIVGFQAGAGHNDAAAARSRCLTICSGKPASRSKCRCASGFGSGRSLFDGGILMRLSTPSQIDAPARASAPAMEELIGVAHPILDHGFVRVVDYLGDDAAIVQAARVSYAGGTKTVREDAKLIGHLWRHGQLAVRDVCNQVARQIADFRCAADGSDIVPPPLTRSRARYSVLPGEFYIPNGSRNRTPRTGKGTPIRSTRS